MELINFEFARKSWCMPIISNWGLSSFVDKQWLRQVGR